MFLFYPLNKGCVEPEGAQIVQCKVVVFFCLSIVGSQAPQFLTTLAVLP